jgi:transposase
MRSGIVCHGAAIPAAPRSSRWRKLELLANIVLLPLPPYSLELNPMENVWDYLRAKQTLRRRLG